MFSIPSKTALCRTIAFSSTLLLAACGGGGNPQPPAPDPDPKPPAIELAANVTNLVAGATVGQPYSGWKDGSGTGTPIDGVGCATSETYHLHMVLSIYLNGVRQALPAQLGITGCTYELHTHDSTGIIHLEAATQRSYTLGQFFSVWGQPLSTSNVAGISGAASFYLIDMDSAKVTAFTGDPKTIPIQAHHEVAIVIGTPPARLDKDQMPAGD